MTQTHFRYEQRVSVICPHCKFANDVCYWHNDSVTMKIVSCSRKVNCGGVFKVEIKIIKPKVVVTKLVEQVPKGDFEDMP